MTIIKSLFKIRINLIISKKKGRNDFWRKLVYFRITSFKNYTKNRKVEMTCEGKWLIKLFIYIIIREKQDYETYVN